MKKKYLIPIIGLLLLSLLFYFLPQKVIQNQEFLEITPTTEVKFSIDSESYEFYQDTVKLLNETKINPIIYGRLNWKNIKEYKTQKNDVIVETNNVQYGIIDSELYFRILDENFFSKNYYEFLNEPGYNNKIHSCTDFECRTQAQKQGVNLITVLRKTKEGQILSITLKKVLNEFNEENLKNYMAQQLKGATSETQIVCERTPNYYQELSCGYKDYPIFCGQENKRGLICE